MGSHHSRRGLFSWARRRRAIAVFAVVGSVFLAGGAAGTAAARDLSPDPADRSEEFAQDDSEVETAVPPLAEPQPPDPEDLDAAADERASAAARANRTASSEVDEAEEEKEEAPELGARESSSGSHDPPATEPPWAASGSCTAIRYWGWGQTDSGEHFDPHAKTAAHAELPLGTRVQVTNPRNGRSVVVRINDRGSGEGDCFALTSAAFNKIYGWHRDALHVDWEVVD